MEDRPDRRGDADQIRVQEIEQGLLAVSVTGQRQLARIAIEEAERPHAVERADAIELPPREELKDELRIACSAERLIAKRLLEIPVIVDFAVVDSAPCASDYWLK